jgi:hypothetical protein
MDPANRGPSLGIASLNTAGPLRPGPDRLLPFDLRAAEISRSLEAENLDVLLLQEVWLPRYLATFRRLLPTYEFVAWKRGRLGQVAGGLATFSRLPLAQSRYTSFRRAGVRTGGLRFRAELRARSVNQGVLTTHLPGVGAVVGNVHLVSNREGDWSVGNRHEPVQREQLAIMHAALTRANAEGRTSAQNRQSRTTDLAIVGGDFNLASDGSLYGAITDGGTWRDSFAELAAGELDSSADGRDQRPPVTTFRLECLPPGATAHRIDYLLVAGDPQHEILEHGLLFEDPVRFPDGRTGQVSDHLGVYCRVGISGSG